MMFGLVVPNEQDRIRRASAWRIRSCSFGCDKESAHEEETSNLRLR